MITIAYNKREGHDIYVFDILYVTEVSSFKIGCAVVNLTTNNCSVHGSNVSNELAIKCLETARELRSVFGE